LAISEDYDYSKYVCESDKNKSKKMFAFVV
jgi:hypothetical protein